MAMVEFKRNDTLLKEKAAAIQFETDAMNLAQAEVLNTSSIVTFLRTRWDRARRGKIMSIEPQMFKNLRQAMSEYEPRKLAAIREMGTGSDVFMGITDVKCRNAIAWINDILFQPNAKPWGVD